MRREAPKKSTGITKESIHSSPVKSRRRTKKTRRRVKKNGQLADQNVDIKYMKRMADPATILPTPTSPTPADPHCEDHIMNTTPDSGVELTSPEPSPQLSQTQISTPDVLSGPQTDMEAEGGPITAENEPEVRTDVVRESDQTEQELPAQGFAQNLLSKFQVMEVEATLSKKKEHKPSGAASRPVGPVVRHDRTKIDASHFVNPESDDEDFGAHGGVYESEPVHREDVAREDQRKDEEELPPAGSTKSLLSAFKDMQQRSNDTSPLRSPLRSRTISRVDSISSMPGSLADTLSIYSDTNVSGAYSENIPQVRDDVAKEGDSLETENLPAFGTTKNLLSMFSKVNEDTKKMTQKLHKPSGLGTRQWKSKLPPVMTKPSAESNPEPAPASAVNTESADIAREEPGTVNEEELPKSGFAKGLLSKFKSIEAAAPASSKPIRVGSIKVIKQAWCADVVNAKKNSRSTVNPEPNQVEKEFPCEDKSLASETSNTTDNESSELTPTNSSNVPQESPEVKTTHQVTESIEGDKVVENGHTTTAKVKVSTDTIIATKKETIPNKLATSKPQPSSAMAKFIKMESQKPKVPEHIPSQAASKPTPTPMGRKL